MNQPPEEQSKRTNYFACLFALAIAFLIGAGLLLISTRFGLGALILGGALISAVAFHYFVWGKWLGAILRAEQQAEDRRAREEDET